MPHVPSLLASSTPCLLPSSTHLCEQLLSREQVQRHGEAPIATSNMVPLPTMEIFDTAPSLVSRGCSDWWDLGHQRLCLQLALEAGNGDGATETKELVDRRRGHGCGRALTVRDARCGRLSETGAHSSRCERAGLFWWWPTSVPGCGQQRGELGVGRRCRAREQRKVRGRVNLRAWVADASRNGASNLVSVSGGLGAGSRTSSANPRLRGSARVLALLGAGRGRGAAGPGEYHVLGGGGVAAGAARYRSGLRGSCLLSGQETPIMAPTAPPAPARGAIPLGY